MGLEVYEREIKAFIQKDESVLLPFCKFKDLKNPFIKYEFRTSPYNRADIAIFNWDLKFIWIIELKSITRWYTLKQVQAYMKDVREKYKPKSFQVSVISAEYDTENIRLLSKNCIDILCFSKQRGIFQYGAHQCRGNFLRGF